jgi:hypothetical protein
VIAVLQVLDRVITTAITSPPCDDDLRRRPASTYILRARIKLSAASRPRRRDTGQLISSVCCGARAFGRAPGTRRRREAKAEWRG